MSDLQQIIEKDHRRIRLEVLLRRILHGLESTILLEGMSPDTPIDDVRPRLTNKSAEYLAPLVEALDILESIIFASDGCMGHRQCAHSMEPWQRARALLDGKWKAEEDPSIRWP